MKKLELLRPFDPDQAKAGAPICYAPNPDNMATYLAGPDDRGVIAYRAASGRIHTTTATAFRMQPLAWVEEKPVYKGDTLWCQVGPIGRQIVVDKLYPHDTQRLLLIDGGIVKADNSDGYLSWEAPKPKTETVKFLAYMNPTTGGLIRRDARCKPNPNWRRVPGADRTEEVEL